jgi:hypothetical protein
MMYIDPFIIRGDAVDKGIHFDLSRKSIIVTKLPSSFVHPSSHCNHFSYESHFSSESSGLDFGRAAHSNAIA